MKNNASLEGTSEDLLSNLNLIYSYYCRLNTSKLKHQNFDQVSGKSETMDLHEFMTFCKDVGITSKQHKTQQRNNKTLKTQTKVETERQKVFEEVIQKVAPPTIELEIEEPNNQNGQIVLGEENEIQIGLKREELSSKVFKKEVIVKETTVQIVPQQYLDEKVLSNIFKKYASASGESDFHQFSMTMSVVASKMYSLVKKQSKEIEKNQVKSNKTLEKKRSSKRSSKNLNQGNLQNLMRHLKIDSKQSIFDVFRSINQKHGRLDHLVMMRSPIKKIKVSDPLGRYAGMQNKNDDHQRLIQATNKLKPKHNTLPFVASNRVYKTSLQHTKEQNTKGINKENIHKFLSKNKSQIDLINSSLGTISRIIIDPHKMEQSRVKLEHHKNIVDIGLQKRPKKYSQRHKDRILGNHYNKELDRLIDASELYSDEIFNKYLEVNRKTSQKQQLTRKAVQSRVLFSNDS